MLTVKAKYLKERAARIEAAATIGHRERSGEIRLASSGTHARVILTLDDVTVATPAGEALFRTGRLHVFQGDRVVLLGRNGAGKSQFVRLLHRAMTDGTDGIRVTPSTVLGFTDQDMAQLSPHATPAASLAPFRLGDARERSLLAAAGFAPEKQSRPIAELSFGQKARLGLLVLRLTEPNLYLMDEPTNHVDIAGRERLEDELLRQGTTAVLVSHDRSFVRNVGTRYWLIERRKLVEVDGPEGFFAEMAAARD